jgi:hypothetical protein
LDSRRSDKETNTMSHIPLDDRGGESLLHAQLRMHVRELVEKIGRRAALDGLVGKIWEIRHEFPPDHPIQDLLARYDPETGIFDDPDDPVCKEDDPDSDDTGPSQELGDDPDAWKLR